MSASNNAIRVMLIEPEPMLRDAIGCLLEQRPDVEVVGQVADAKYLSHIAARTTPDVIVANSRLLGGDAQEGVWAARSSRPEMRLVALLSERHPESVSQLIAGLIGAAVAGFVSTQDHSETLFEAVRAAAHRDEIYLSPSIATRLGEQNGEVRMALELLTARERQVLKLAALGHTNGRIAEELGLAAGTVRNHLSAVYAKLEVSTRAEAVAWAWRHGLVNVRRRGGKAPAEM